MGSVRKRAGSWEAFVGKTVSGERVRKTATFTTKAEAQSWIAMTESDLLSGKTGAIPNKTVGDLFLEYSLKVSPKKDGCDWEVKKLKAAQRMKLAEIPLKDLSACHIAEWRDSRLTVDKVKASTVSREWNLFSNAFNIAVNEWKWLPRNPMATVKRPDPGPARDRLWTDDEIGRIKHVLKYREGEMKTVTEQVGVAFLFALETAMRAGEILRITPKDLNGRVLKVGKGKTDAARREVPMSKRALELLGQVGGRFSIDSSQLSSNFRKAKSLACVDGVTFHDSRANAITRLAKKLDILDLARAIGHKDLKMLMVYYREDAQTIAKRLDD